VLAIVLCEPARSQSGYEFSLGASDTDPFVNVSAPTRGSRKIYFWPTCIEEGLSAFEGDLISTLTGGTLCLGPSAANGVLGAVDCNQLSPAFTQDPIVVGVSSGGSAPCSTGAAACAEDAGSSFGTVGA
jgi:hypothetical protein